MTDHSDTNRVRITQAREANQTVSSQFHAEEDPATSVIVPLEDTFRTIAGNELLEFVRYGAQVLEDQDGFDIHLIGITAAGVVEGKAQVREGEHVVPSSVAFRWWRDVVEYGFTGTAGYSRGTTSDEDKPRGSRLYVKFETSEDTLELHLSGATQARFTYDELVAIADLIRVARD